MPLINFSMKNLMLMVFLLFTCNVFAQKTVTGLVTSETDGSPIPGVNIMVKGTNKGAVTNIDGKFSVSVTDNKATLVFSFIGYLSKEVAVTAGTNVNVQLKEDSKNLDEVVVTALGIKRQTKALGYSVTELKGDDLNKNSINPVTSLQGKVAGLEVANSDGGLFGSAKIQIRGISTLKGNNQPIYVIDGVIIDNPVSNSGDADWSSNANDFGNELKNLNPDDIETQTALKGAAATALYGSRGIGGAIVITTKSGKNKKGLGINVSQSFGIDHVYGTPNLQKEYGEGAFSGLVDYGKVDPATGGYYKFDNANQFIINADGKPTLRSGNYGLYYGPKFSDYSSTMIEDFDGKYIPYQAYKNNYKDAFNLGYNTNTNVTITGANENFNFYNSVSYKKATGTLPNNSFERLSLLTKAGYNITKKVKLEASFSFANSLPKNPQPNIGEYFSGGVFGPSYNTNKYMKDYKGFHGGLPSTSYGDANGYNPGSDLWFSIYEYSNTQKENNIRPTLTLDAEILDWLKFKTEANYNYYYVRGESKQLGTGYANEGGSYSISQSTKEQTNINAMFLFDKKVGDWNYGGFLRGEYFNNYVQALSASTSGGLIIPGQYFLSNSKENIRTNGGISDTKRTMSFAFQAAVSWRNQVFFDVTGRNDWSSTLVYSNAKGNNSYFYPSVNGSWLINETFKLPEWISFAKIRGSWAQVGNGTDPYLINPGYSLNTWASTGSNIYGLTVVDYVLQPNLKPQLKTSWEVGLDWRFFNSRVNLDATFYKENTRDQIMSIAVPDVSGVKTKVINAGNIQNMGIEIALNTIPFKNKDWEWSLDFTYTKNENKVISLDPNVADYILLSGDPAYGNYRIGSVAKVGGSYGLLMSDAAPKRDAQGNVVLNWNSTYRTAYPARSGKVEQVGKITPDFLGSMSTGLKWKSLSMKVSLDARFGGYVASYGSRYGTAYGTTETSLTWRDPEHGGMTFTSIWDGKTYTDGMIPNGVFAAGQTIALPSGATQNVGGMTFKEAYEKGYVDPVHASAYNYYSNSWSRGTINDSWFTKLSYIALRDITVSYSLPQSIYSKIGAKNLIVSFNAHNLGYLYNTLPNNESPESIRGTTYSEFRIRNFSPYTASYVFTLNVGF